MHEMVLAWMRKRVHDPVLRAAASGELRTSRLEKRSRPARARRSHVRQRDDRRLCFPAPCSLLFAPWGGKPANG